MYQPPPYSQPAQVPAPKKSRRRLWIILSIIGGILVASCVTCGVIGAFNPVPKAVATPTQAVAQAPTSTPTPTFTAQATRSSTPSPTPTPKPTQVVWSQGAIQIFHSSDYQGIGGYSDSFTVPALWRMHWFCQAGSDPTQAFFSIDVQHAGDYTNADGETPVQVDCNQTPNGVTVEHISGNVTLQILSGTGTSWDIYVQTPQ